MDIRAVVLAKKYARAYLNVFMASIAFEDIERLCSFEQFLETHKLAMFFFGLPHISLISKIRCIGLLVAKFSLPQSLARLLTMLIESGRTALMQEVIKQIGEEYRKRKNIQFFAITSSHQLKPEEIDAIQRKLEHATKSKVICSHHVDKELIAGLRALSSNFLWEYSIAKQLRLLTRAAYR